MSEPLWVPIGAVSAVGDELAYAQITADVSVTASAEATPNDVVTAPTITVDGVTDIMVEFFAPNISTPANVGSGTVLNLWDGSTDLGRIVATGTPAAGNVGWPATGRRRLTPSAGTHTYRVRAWVAGGSPGAVNVGAGGVGTRVPAFIRVSTVRPTGVGAGGVLPPVSYGTSLPTSPADGQEAILVDSLTAANYMWRFRYNAGAGAYKWEFVGGTDMRAIVATQETTASSSAVNLTTPGPTIALARAGYYRVDVGLWAFVGGGGTCVTDLYLGGVSQGISCFITSAAYQHGFMTTALTAAAGQAVSLLYRTTGGTGNFGSRLLSITPIRVA